jgi:ATP-dependent DNA helicase UvrD/PcrA
MTSLRLHGDLLAGLNPAQREAVLHVEGPLLVLAGAGSGKTRVLTTRIARLIEHHDVQPSQILAVTFTNKAAGEMRSRIARLLGDEPAGMWCGTFHAIGARLLRRHATLLGRTPSFTIYDEDDMLAAVKHIMERLRISPCEHPPQAIIASISDARNALVTAVEYEQLALDPHSRAAAQVFRQLDAAMRQANAAGFDDLLALPVELLRSSDAVLAEYRRRFRFVLVDEYQDTNRAQYEFVSLIGRGSDNVAVVGDDDQSIYGWRGADIRNILDFERDFTGARVIRLEENYRSTPQILDVANAAIRANVDRKGKTLRTTRPPGDVVTVMAALDDRDEADFVVTDMQARRFGPRPRHPRDMAVLYRTNAQSRALEEALRRHGVPYRLVGAVRFYDRREIRDLLAYLRLIANPADDEAFRRAVAVPRRGVGDGTIAALGEAAERLGVPMLQAATRPAISATLRPAARAALDEFARCLTRLRARAHEAPVDELIRDLVTAIGYEEHLRAEGPESAERLENVRELITGAAETVQEEGGEIGLTPLDHFLQRATLITSVDTLDAGADAVMLMTLHNAKGLEFPVVYITGLDEGLFPLSRSRDDPRQLEEERRLFYVGITRAGDALTLCHARSRRRNGEVLPSLPSSFLGEIPESLVRQRATARLRGSGRWFERPGASTRRPGLPAPRRPGVPVTRWEPSPVDEDESQDTPRFAPGERVKHPRFGGGTIVDLSGAGRDTKVTVDFDDEEVGRKRLVVAFAGLQAGLE